MSFQVTHTSFAITFGSRNYELKVYVKIPKKFKRERNLTCQVNGCCLVRELYKVISVLFYLLLGLGNSEAIGKKTIDRVAITEFKQVTDGMTLLCACEFNCSCYLCDSVSQVVMYDYKIGQL